MRLPFTPDEFFAIFREYNQTFWPAPVVLALLAFASIGLVARPSRWSDRFIAVVLSLLWMWMAVGYHFWFFSRINPLAYAFAAMFAMGSALFCWNGVVRTKMHFSFKWRGVRTAAGISLVLYALLIYPLLLIAGGHRYPAAPTFGLPCPTTIFTLGMLASRIH